LRPYTSFVILPLFALANAGVDLTPDATGSSIASPVALGIVVGLVVGKPLGILLAALVAAKVLRASLPVHAGWVELAGIGMLAGIGFTVSLFVTGLAFEGPLETDAKLAILVASVIAGALGAGFLTLRSTTHPLIPDEPASEGPDDDEPN
jgi:NhaA family Na+:H+ antiporter